MLLRTDENATSPEAEAYLKKNQGYYEWSWLANN